MRSICLALVSGHAAAPAHAQSPISSTRQLTFACERAGQGCFGPDGERMVFQSERTPGNPFYRMYGLDLTTGDVARISTGIGKTTCGWRHPDGRPALFASTQFDPEAQANTQTEFDSCESGQTRR